MNDNKTIKKLQSQHSQGISPKNEMNGQLQSQRSEVEWGQLYTEDNEKIEDHNINDGRGYTLRTEESESGELNLITPHHPSQIKQKLNKLNQKHSIVEEEDNNNSEDLNEIIQIDAQSIKSFHQQKAFAKAVNQMKNSEEVKDEHEEDQQQESFLPSDNIEFHSLASLEKIQSQRQHENQDENKKIQNNKTETEMTQFGSSIKAFKGTIGSQKSTNQMLNFNSNQESRQQYNKSQTILDSISPNKLLVEDASKRQGIRMIKTQVDESPHQKQITLPNKMLTSLMDSKINEVAIEQSNKIPGKDIRRGGVQNSNMKEFMSSSQKRKTFLNLRAGTAKIKNFFSRTFADQESSVLVLLLNAWRFISSLKRISPIWRPNMLSSKQIDFIDDSCHFDRDQYSGRKRKKLFSSFTISKDQLKQSMSIQGRKKSQDSQLMKWMLNTLKFIPIINPQSQTLYLWDTIHSLFIILNLVIQPIEFVTYTHMEKEYTAYFWNIFPRVCIFIFIADILLNFNTGFYQRGMCIMDRKSVMTNYFKKGFIWDLLSLLPIIDSLAQFESAWRVVNVFIVCKYVTLRAILGKYLELFQLQNQVFIPTFIKLLKVGFLVLFQAHLFACLFLGLSVLEKSYNLTDTTWIEHYSNQQQEYKPADKRLTDETVFSQYIYAFYWSVTTMTTTGYGDITASNNYEATFTAFSMIIAGGVFAYSFNSIGIIVSDLNKRNSEFQKDMSLISKYLKDINIKRSLQMEVTKYIEYKHRAETELSTKEEKEVLEKLGPQIRDKITMSANIQLIKQVPFLINNFSRKFLRKLALFMQKETYLNNEILFEENEFYANYSPNQYGMIQNMQINQQQQQQQQMIQHLNNQQFQNHQMHQQLNGPAHSINTQIGGCPILNNQNPFSYPNIQGSQSLQLPNQHQIQQIPLNGYIQNNNYNNIQQPNSQQGVQQGQILYNANHARKLSGSQNQPNLIQNYLNMNLGNGINVNSPHIMNQQQNLQNANRLSASVVPNQLSYNQYNYENNNQQNPNYNMNQINPSYQFNQINHNQDDYYYAQTLQQSQSDISFYIVERGTIQLYTKCYKYINDDETTKPIKELKKGDLFGELSFFTEKPRCASAKSIGPCSVLTIKKRDFIKLLKEYPSDYEIYCQIHDEILNNKNLDSLQLRCYSCEKIGHTSLNCNRIHYQPDLEKVILTHNFKESSQSERSKDVFRSVLKYKSLQYLKEINSGQKKIEAVLNQGQISSNPSQQHNFTAFVNNNNQKQSNNIISTNPFQRSPTSQPYNTQPISNPMNPQIRGNQKKLTLRQLQTLQTQIVDQDVFYPPSPLQPPNLQNQPNYAFNFQANNQGYQNQGTQQQQTQIQNAHNLNNLRNFQNNNHRSSLLEHPSQDGANIPSQISNNFLSPFQQKMRGSHLNEIIIFEDDNETPIEKDSNSTKERQQFISPTTVDTNVQPENPSINSVAQSSDPHHKKSLEQGNQIFQQVKDNLTTPFNPVKAKPTQEQIRRSFIESHQKHKSSLSINGRKILLNSDNENQKIKFLDKPPQQKKFLIKDIAAAMGDDYRQSFQSSNDDSNDLNYEDIDEIQYHRQRQLRNPALNKQKSFTTETTPYNKKILKKINQMYQNYPIPNQGSKFLQKNLLFQHLQSTFMNEMNDQDLINLDDAMCEEDINSNLIEMRNQNRKQTLINNNQHHHHQIILAKKEMIFEFPSINTDRMKHFTSYFTNYNCSAVLERLAAYRPNMFHKRNRQYHIYDRSTVKQGFQKSSSLHIVTPANSRASNQISKIANIILNSTVKDKKSNFYSKPTEQKPNKKLSIIESKQNKLPVTQNQLVLSSHFKFRSQTIYQDESDDEF